MISKRMSRMFWRVATISATAFSIEEWVPLMTVATVSIAVLRV